MDSFLAKIYSPLGYERVYLPLCEVADTPFHIPAENLCLLVFINLKANIPPVFETKKLSNGSNLS